MQEPKVHAEGAEHKEETLETTAADTMEQFDREKDKQSRYQREENLNEKIPIITSERIKFFNLISYNHQKNYCRHNQNRMQAICYQPMQYVENVIFSYYDAEYC